jgi:hypothetical protein
MPSSRCHISPHLVQSGAQSLQPHAQAAPHRQPPSRHLRFRLIRTLTEGAGLLAGRYGKTIRRVGQRAKRFLCVGQDRLAVEGTYLAADTETEPPPKPITWTIYKVAAKQTWVATVEVPDGWGLRGGREGTAIGHRSQDNTGSLTRDPESQTRQSYIGSLTEPITVS